MVHDVYTGESERWLVYSFPTIFGLSGMVIEKVYVIRIDRMKTSMMIIFNAVNLCFILFIYIRNFKVFIILVNNFYFEIINFDFFSF